MQLPSTAHFRKTGLNWIRAKQPATRTTNSYIRALKCIFSKKHLNNLRHLDLPAELPGTTLSYLPEGSKRYHSKMDPAGLIKAAGKELAQAEPEVYKAFLLALIAGLRRSEIDLLLWDAVDFADGCLRVQPTAFHELKTFSSEGTVYLQQEAVDFLKQCFEADPDAGPFVLKSHRPPRLD